MRFEPEAFRRCMLDEYRDEIPHTRLPQPIVLFLDDSRDVISLQRRKSRREPIYDEVDPIACAIRLSHTRIVRPLLATHKRAQGRCFPFGSDPSGSPCDSRRCRSRQPEAGILQVESGRSVV